MKLLFFLYALDGGGGARVLANLSSQLARKGYDVTIALNINEVNYDLSPEVNIVIAPDRKWEKGHSVTKKFVRFIQINKHFSLFVKDTIQSIHPDVIISFYHTNMEAIIRYHGNIPIILSEHNAFDRKRGVLHYFERFKRSRLFDKVCVLTPFDKGYASAKGMKNTVIMPNPNTFDCISEQEYNELFPKRRNILVCGRLDDWEIKGFDIAIKVFSKIANKYPDVDLDVVGGGADESKKQLLKIAEDCCVSKRIHFWGRRNDIKDIMRNHLLFLLTSRTEGFPMVLTEAMSQGLPSVSFEKLAFSIVNNTIDGFLINDGDVDSMIDTISDLLSNSQLRCEIGKKAANNVKRFSSETICTRWEKLLHGLNE